VAENEQLIAEIMGAQQRLQHLFAYDRSDPLFTSHLTVSQLKILLLLSQRGTVSGRELADLLGVGLAALTGMIDRLVANDLVIRQEDPHDRRVRRISLSKTGAELIGRIITAGAERQRQLLSRLSASELAVVAQAMELLVRVAAEEAMSGADAAPGAGARPGADAAPGAGAAPGEVAGTDAAPGADAAPGEVAGTDAAPGEIEGARRSGQVESARRG
jgi:DNA-binding MarR family transcriptional regulator